VRAPAVERRHAQEHVRRLAEDAPLGERDERRPEPPPAPVGVERDRADVARERAAHAEDEEAGDRGGFGSLGRGGARGPGRHGDVHLRVRVAHHRERPLVRPPQGDPRLAGRHDLGARRRLLCPRQAAHRDARTTDLDDLGRVHTRTVTPRVAHVQRRSIRNSLWLYLATPVASGAVRRAITTQPRARTLRPMRRALVARGSATSPAAAAGGAPAALLPRTAP
jgi:hypothetical protein